MESARWRGWQGRWQSNPAGQPSKTPAKIGRGLVIGHPNLIVHFAGGNIPPHEHPKLDAEAERELRRGRIPRLQQRLDEAHAERRRSAIPRIVAPLANPE